MAVDWMFVNMYRPRGWAALAEGLAAGIQGNGAPLMNAVLNTIELNTTKKAQTAMAIEAVTCVDGPELWNVDPHKVVEAVVEENVLTYEKVSPHFAAVEVGLPLDKSLTPKLTLSRLSRFPCAFTGNQGSPSALLALSILPHSQTTFWLLETQLTCVIQLRSDAQGLTTSP
jgi:hypothetical protein